MQNTIKSQIQKKLKILNSRVLSNNKLPLSVIQYDAADIVNCLDTLTRGWPTIGKEVANVEKKIQKLLKTKNAIMLNSGGSSNFLILYLLCSVYAKKKDKLKSGDEVLTPAVTWSTTVGPIIQNNLVPVLVDVNLATYDINVELLEKAITKKTKAIMLVHPLGHVCDMEKILRVCKKYNLVLIEDNCESIGAKYKNKFSGTFGKFASISLYQSHHISSVEGGMILTDDDYYADILRSLRANGWLREVTNKKTKNEFIKSNKNIDQSFMFPYIGFNFKPTDMAAALVSNQIDKLNSFISIRSEAANNLIAGLKKYEDYLILPKNVKNVKNSWFTFPITVKPNKKFFKIKLVDFLSKNKIANRPIIAGNIADQPFLKKFRFKKTALENSKLVMSSGFFIGLNHKLDKRNIKYILSVFDNFFKKII
jgi:CDP-4-dehydro-6-deoxyglucose reductase, E1